MSSSNESVSFNSKPSCEHWNVIQRIYNRSNHPDLIGLSSTNRLMMAKKYYQALKVDLNWFVTYQSLVNKHNEFMPIQKKNTRKQKQSNTIKSMFASYKNKNINNRSNNSESSSSTNSESVNVNANDARIRDLQKQKLHYITNDDLVNAQRIKLEIELLKLGKNTPHLSTKNTKPAPSKPTRVYKTPAVDRLKAELSAIIMQIEIKQKSRTLLKRTKDPLYETVNGEYKVLRKQKIYIEKQIKSKMSRARNQRHWRQKKRKQDKKVKNILKEKDIDFGEDYCYYDNVGKPRIERTSRGKYLALAMQQEAAPHCTTNPRRRAMDNICNLTLSKLASKVNENIQERFPNQTMKPIHPQTMYNRTS